ncbi:hypothetical protein [Cutibacterium avidum]|uniref:hypothetical protein n=1 Tax=Cutibacterium avidum TaxID=33010 RepID=UPI001E48F24C|nr:hypothetical protein [Cutibacterium avidum]
MLMILAPRKKNEARRIRRRDRRAAERAEAAEADKAYEAQRAAAGTRQEKEREGSRDNMDPDIDL